MTTRTITKGSKVVIHVTGSARMTLRGVHTVLHAPCDTGDWWQVQNDFTKVITALNPNSSELTGFTLVIGEDTPEDLGIEHKALQLIAKQAKVGYVETTLGEVDCPYCLTLVRIAELALKGTLATP